MRSYTIAVCQRMVGMQSRSTQGARRVQAICRHAQVSQQVHAAMAPHLAGLDLLAVGSMTQVTDGYWLEHAPRTTETPWAKKEVPASKSGVMAMTRLVAPGLSTTASLKKMGKNLTCAMLRQVFGIGPRAFARCVIPPLLRGVTSKFIGFWSQPWRNA